MNRVNNNLHSLKEQQCYDAGVKVGRRITEDEKANIYDAGKDMGRMEERERIKEIIEEYSHRNFGSRTFASKVCMDLLEKISPGS